MHEPLPASRHPAVAGRGATPLAYAQPYPERVTELVLSAVGLTDTAGVQWVTETVPPADLLP
jgi:hypothetical protein